MKFFILSLMRNSVKSKTCKHCESENHLSIQCFKRPKRVIKAGRVANRWQTTRRQWFKANQRESYSCHYCGRFLLKNEVELDHYLSRSRRPDLRFELSNLVPSCHRCNQEKGSMSGDEYLNKVGRCQRTYRQTIYRWIPRIRYRESNAELNRDY